MQQAKAGTKQLAPVLKALLERLIDYAGMYPPAGLSLEETLANYNQYRQSDYAWMLNSLVIGASELDRVPASLDGSLAVLAESDESRAATLETKKIVAAERPVYCEVPLESMHELERIKQSGCYAKIRTGGVKPEAIPAPASVSSFILACADLRLPFKATAGLHHPVRAEHALTYEPVALRAVMHGFLNILMASSFAWHGERDIEVIIGETDPSAFAFDDKAHWRGKSLDAKQIREARKNFIHSIGSCSFEEPVTELQALGLL
ncbi:MAG TPA: hypothetical protein V6D17_14115 [Candidatus Obscuribacterales bacterium]